VIVLGMPEIRVGRLLAAALAVTCLLGGCSGAKSDPKAEAPPVATLRSADAPAASRPAVDDDLRPLLRLDATDEERNAAVKVWADCVRTTGGPGYEEPKMIYKYLHEKDPKAKKVEAACHNKFPETYEERQKRTDLATFKDNQRQWYQCAQKAGYKLNPPDEDGVFGLSEIGPQGDFGSEKMENCRKEAFRQ
jgi:hypothetical protein